MSLQLKYILTASVMTVVQYMPVSTLLQCLASPVRVAVQLTSLDSYPSVNAVEMAMGAVSCMDLVYIVCRTDPNIIVRNATLL